MKLQSSQWYERLRAAKGAITANLWRCGGVIAVVLLIFAGKVFAQPLYPDLAITFLVDESRSLTAGNQNYQERLYNSVYFMKEPVREICQESVCYVGVSRFSERPVTLISPKDVESWGEADLTMLDARPVDLNDRSNFPQALAETCANLPNAQNKLLVLLTDGNLRSEENPDFAPIAGSISRSSFIEQIDHSIESCLSNGVKLYTFLMHIDQSNDASKAYQDEEKDLWQNWSNTTGGFNLQAESPDDPEAVIEFLNAIARGAALPEELRIEYASDGELPLGDVEPHLRLVEYNVVGLRPYILAVNAPEGQTTQDATAAVRRNQTRVTVRLPAPGQWTTQVGGSDDENPFIVRLVTEEPETYSLQLASPADQSEIVAQGDLIISLKVLAEETSGSQILGQAAIAGELSDSFGAQIDLDFFPDSATGVYRSTPFSGIVPTAGSYTLIVPSQIIDGVLLNELRADFKITDEPFITTWEPYPEIKTIEAGKTISLSVEIGNHQLLANPPKLQVVFSNEVDGDTARPPVTGDEYRPGEFRIPFTVPQPVGSPADYEVWIRLVGDITKQGISFSDKDSPIRRSLTILPIPTPHPIPTATPPLEVAPPPLIDPQLARGAARIVLGILALYALVWLVVVSLWLWAIRLAKPYKKFIYADQALGAPWIIFTWPFARRFRRIQDDLPLADPSDETTSTDDEDNGINTVIDYLEKRFRSHAPKSLRLMGQWDDAFSKIRGGLRPNSPHNSIYIAAASQVVNRVIENCLVAHQTKTAGEFSPTPADLHHDLLRKEFDPILPTNAVR